MSESHSNPSHPLLPAPEHRRAGDFVYVSSIYPLDDDGRLVGSTAPSPWAGESDAATQTRAVLDRLGRILEAAGSSLERVVKIEIQLSDPTDFSEFKHVYGQFFESELPARTTVVVGDEHPLPGALLNLHAVALAGDSTLDREVIVADGAADPREAELAPHAVKAGPFLFCSGLPASDWENGIAVRRGKGFPNFGNPADMQANYVMDQLEAVMSAAGTDLKEALKVQIYLNDLQNFFAVDSVWGERMGVPPSRSTMGVRGFLVPEALWLPNLLMLVPGQGLEKQETREGIPWHPVDIGRANFSPGILAGDWLFTAGQIPVDNLLVHEWAGAPGGLPHHYDDMEIQAGHTIEMLRTQLAANGFGLEDVVDARIFLVDPRRDLRGFARAWEAAWPDPSTRPAMSLIPSTQRDGSSGVLVEGPMIEIDLTCKRGDR